MTDPESSAPPPRRTLAASRQSRWPGWIWAVPIAAVGIVIWLMLRAFSHRGVDVTVLFEEASQMKPQDTKVRYRGLEVGRVSRIELTQDRQRVIVHLDMDRTVEADLASGTRFFLQGTELSFSDPSSLKAMIAGPWILMVPGAGAATRHFVGLTGKLPEALAVKVPYVANFEGEVGKLKPGSPVTLRGFTVGEVERVELSTNAQTGEVVTPVVFALDPTRLHIRGMAPVRGDWAAPMKASMTQLVQHGLRASLTQQPPLIGSQQVELVIAPEASAATLLTRGGYPEIPAQRGRLEDLPAKLGQLPLREIGDNVRAISEQIRALSASPHLKESLEHIDRALGELDITLHAVGPKLAPTIDSLRETVEGLKHTADEIDSTAEAGRRMMGGSAASPNGNLQQAVHELTGAARAIRTLANYLDQHPEALVRGRLSSTD